MDFLKEYISSVFATPLDTAAQIVGFMAMASAIFCFMQKDRHKILVWQIIVTSLWTLSFILLRTPTGASINGMQVARGIVFYNKEKHAWAQKSIWLYVFIAITVILGAITYESPISILPVIGTIFSCISLWMKKPLHIRLLTYPVSLCWGIYDAMSNAIFGTCNEIFVVITITITIFAVDLKKNKEVSQ